VLKYPPSIWDKVSATELTKFVSERADYWFYYFVQKMSETAERLGDDELSLHLFEAWHNRPRN
jgi:hypothetical protein